MCGSPGIYGKMLLVTMCIATYELGANSSLLSPSACSHADLREDVDREDHHPRG